MQGLNRTAIRPRTGTRLCQLLRIEGRLAAILAADIFGYSSQTERLKPGRSPQSEPFAPKEMLPRAKTHPGGS